MSIIDRYILREIFKVFFLAVLVLTSVLFLDKILYLTELIINKNVSIINIIRLLLYICPAFLAITIPMGVLVASLIAFSHLSADSEVVAMKATGISFIRMLRPVLLFSTMTYMVTNLIMIYALPLGNQSFRDLIFNILRSHPGYAIKEGIFNSQYKGVILYVMKKDPKNPLMKGIFISDSTSGEGQRVITASEGVLLTDKDSHTLIFQLKDGSIHEVGDGEKGYRLLSFDNYNLSMNIPDPTRKGAKLTKGNREMSINELLKKIQDLKAMGKGYNMELVELNKKFSIPFTCMLLGFIGAPLGIKTARAGRSGGFAMSLGVILFYYICLIAGESLGGAGKVHPSIAIWTPNLLLLLLGAYLVSKTSREAPFVLMEKTADWIMGIVRKIKKALFKEMEIRV